MTHLIYSSSCAVYGAPSKMPIRKSTPLNPISPYGNAKLAAEKYAIEATERGLKQLYILRYFNVIGADPKNRLGEHPREELERYSRLAPACYNVALGKRSHLTIHGTTYNTSDGTAVRDYIHVWDLVRAHLAAMRVMFSSGQEKVHIANVGTGTGTSILQFITACQAATGQHIRVDSVPAKSGQPPMLYAESYFGDTSDWHPEYTNLTEALATGWNYITKVLKQHPRGTSPAR
eukprot:gnl/TRDRNA2_/TRDRNA2_84974_c0_seq1.p1 gnl/TRDRNA2_/TRDRNA2_84974_c0~~gnl/TRDRNA2_/TRDRNA2_84974_c0_seq1.p1  ORF type:complete len:233 (+),score=17.68 gnl/TRDRNA2_/TRDRNA2_84974_c0_seq1:83-781(+)